MITGHEIHTHQHDLPDIVAGDTFNRSVRFTFNGEVKDISDWSLVTLVKEDPTDNDSEALFEDQGTHLDEEGVIQLQFTQTQTEGLVGTKWYKTTLIAPGGAEQTVLKGKVHFSK